MTSPSVLTARLAQGTIAWRESGAGSPLVFLHGLTTNSREWLPVFTRLSRDFRVIAWDCPGYGVSSQIKAHEPQALDYAAMLAALLDHLEIERAGLVGNWFGGVIAGAFAAKWPERVDLLVASGMKSVPTQQEANEFLQWLQELLAAGGQSIASRVVDKMVAPGCDAKARAWLSGMISELGPIGFGRAAHMLGKTDAPDLFRSVQAPLFLVYGEADQVSLPSEGRPFERVVRGTITEIVGGAGHMPAVEQPDLFARTLRACLRTARFR